MYSWWKNSATVFSYRACALKHLFVVLRKIFLRQDNEIWMRVIVGGLAFRTTRHHARQHPHRMSYAVKNNLRHCNVPPGVYPIAGGREFWSSATVRWQNQRLNLLLTWQLDVSQHEAERPYARDKNIAVYCGAATRSEQSVFQITPFDKLDDSPYHLPHLPA